MLRGIAAIAIGVGVTAEFLFGLLILLAARTVEQQTEAVILLGFGVLTLTVMVGLGALRSNP